MVTIQATGYGQGGGVTETLPVGFAYVSSSLSPSQVDEIGQDVRFTLLGESSFNYTVTASNTAGFPHFSGTLKDFERGDYLVGGHRHGGGSQHGPTPSATGALIRHPWPPVGRAVVVVTIEAADYGQGGGVTETLPTGFAYVSSSLSPSQVTKWPGCQVHPPGRPSSFNYTVTASNTAGGPQLLRYAEGLRAGRLPRAALAGEGQASHGGGSQRHRSFDSTSVAPGARWW